MLPRKPNKNQSTSNAMVVFAGAENMLTIVVFACVIVLFAMMLDLASGLYKAKQRGEVRTSWGLKRTISKFIMYEGSMLIAAGVDVLIHFSRLFVLFGLNPIVGIPIITCIVGIFLLIVEFISVREKADKKTKGDMEKVETAIGKLITKEDLVSILEELKKKGGENEQVD